MRRLISSILLYVIFVAGLNRACAAVWPSHWGDLLVLGRVLSATGKKHGPCLEEFVYRVRVICEFTGQLKSGSEITIDGERRMAGSEISQIPVMAKGALFVFPIDRTKNKAIFKYTYPGGFDFGWLPIGIKASSPVVHADVANLKAALLKYGQLYTRQQVISHKHAYEMLIGKKQNRNYYLWALAVSVIARNATVEDVTNLESAFRNPVIPGRIDPSIKDAVGVPDQNHSLSSRQAFWLIHCLRQVVPPDVRLPCGRLQADLMIYMYRWNTFAEQSNFIP